MTKTPARATLSIVLMTTGTLLAHPHFVKTVAVSMNGFEMNVQYTTYPYNAAHLKEVSEGFVFHCGRAKLTLRGEVTSSGKRVVGGTYRLRAQAQSVDDWTLILLPETDTGNEQNPAVGKGIALETKTLVGQPSIAHLEINLISGHGPTDGKLILSVSFGPRRIETVLTLPVQHSQKS
jgi:hypothetical protein